MKINKKLTATLISAVTAFSSTVAPFGSVNAASELETSLANDSDVQFDFARALQYSMFMYDANMCGNQVDENCLYTWR
ncbi:MAG: hypothetical protein IJO99_03550, partial [Ruminococcus sp.]|nr:hypothetical protein [Ruminococcus sp.]